MCSVLSAAARAAAAAALREDGGAGASRHPGDAAAPAPAAVRARLGLACPRPGPAGERRRQGVERPLLRERPLGAGRALRGVVAEHEGPVWGRTPPSGTRVGLSRAPSASLYLGGRMFRAEPPFLGVCCRCDEVSVLSPSLFWGSFGLPQPGFPPKTAAG